MVLQKLHVETSIRHKPYTQPVTVAGSHRRDQYARRGVLHCCCMQIVGQVSAQVTYPYHFAGKCPASAFAAAPGRGFSLRHVQCHLVIYFPWQRRTAEPRATNVMTQLPGRVSGTALPARRHRRCCGFRLGHVVAAMPRPAIAATTVSCSAGSILETLPLLPS